MEKYVAWCCDFETKTGEGQLAKKFLKEKIKINKIKVLKPKFKFYCSDYIYPFIGVIIVWYYFLSGCKIIYVNFLPLWNPLIFLLCPPKTTFGPITGSIQINNSIKFKSILRKYFFPYLYRLSICILKLRKDKAFFATNILKKYLKKNEIKNYKFNFVLDNLKIKPKSNKNKKYYLIIYYRNHDNKFFFHHKKFINNLTKKNKKIVTIGDYLDIPNIINLGNKNKKQVDLFIKQAKYCLSGDDNILSFFNIRCLQNNLKIIFNYKLRYQVPKKYKKYYISYNYENEKFV